ncbi:uncharacterized protein LOC106646799 [Copidosoma floridanum]|uniref:uncharacterized protein LOC106646799 n=1 Tax=Copidosoma floridanum TaxID=29053 RepID=UPI0006C9D9C4|nr:uncharacterized protein LOC106646799 [Copidosoma floridanum]XP_014218417.1 uncharacterized protein LOC106646799 [Copidosoma floridanum]
MSNKAKKTETEIPIELDKKLTGDSCAHLISGIVKYVMLQKCQIPLAFDQLVKYSQHSQTEKKHMTMITNFIKSMKTMSDKLVEEFNPNQCRVKEIIILFGATIFSPKLCIKIEIPLEILDSERHTCDEHKKGQPLLTVMSSIFQCPEFQDEMALPLGLTNTFILLHKDDPRGISEFFVPKPQFSVPSHKTTTFHIKLEYTVDILDDCKCGRRVPVCRDGVRKFFTHQISYLFRNQDHDSEDVTKKNKFNSDLPLNLAWYQSKEVFKGFKL